MFRNINYKEYELYLDKKWFKLNFYDNEVPQGLCVISNKVYITCYKIDNTNSCVIELDMEGKRLRTIDLNNKSHVGGIGYDKKHNLVFICDSNGRISSYKYNSFEKVGSYNVAATEGSKLLENGKLVCSYLTCYNDKIYVGSFNLKKNGIVKVYDVVRENDGINIIYREEFLAPKKTQGLTFYEYENINYIIFSNSYGRKKNSNIEINKYIEGQSDYSKNNFKLLVPPMLEQIVVYDDSLLLLFESSAFKYKHSSKYVVDELVSLDINDIFKQNKIL